METKNNILSDLGAAAYRMQTEFDAGFVEILQNCILLRAGRKVGIGTNWTERAISFRRIEDSNIDVINKGIDDLKKELNSCE